MILSHPTGSSWFSLSLYSVVEGSSSPGFSISSSFMILASVLKYFNSTSILLLQVFLFNFNIASIPLQYTDSPRRKSSFYLEIQAFHTHKKDQHLSQSFYIPDLFLQCCFCNWIKDIGSVLRLYIYPMTFIMLFGTPADLTALAPDLFIPASRHIQLPCSI